MAPVLLFDGVCSLCNGTIDFVLRHERSSTLTFATLQSEEAKQLLEARMDPAAVEQLLHGQAGAPDSIVLVDDHRVLVRSSAVLALAPHLRWPWRLLGIGWLFPRFLRDAVYRWIAKNRYAWFGKTETCRIPSPEERARFLS